MPTTHAMTIKTLLELQLIMDMILSTMDNFSPPIDSPALAMAVHTCVDDIDWDDSLMPILVPTLTNHFT